MFGIPLVTLLGYAITYGPKIMAILQALQPILAAAEPIIAKLVSDGIPHDTAVTKVLAQMAKPDVTPQEAAFWKDHDIDHF